MASKKRVSKSDEFQIDVRPTRGRGPIRFAGADTDSCASTCGDECTNSCASTCEGGCTDTCETCGSCSSENECFGLENTGGPCLEMIIDTREIVERAARVIEEFSRAIDRSTGRIVTQATKRAQAASATAKRVGARAKK